METLQAMASQLHFSLTLSQLIISFGVLALGAIWGRIKVGIMLFLGTFELFARYGFFIDFGI